MAGNLKSILMKLSRKRITHIFFKTVNEKKIYNCYWRSGICWNEFDKAFIEKVLNYYELHISEFNYKKLIAIYTELL